MNPVGKVFIIPGNYRQFLDYVRDKENRSFYVYVSDITMLRGYHQPRGKFIGTWYDRVDLEDILMQLRLAGSIDQEKVMEIRDRRNTLKVVNEWSALFIGRPERCE